MPLSTRVLRDGLYRGFGEVTTDPPPVESGTYFFESSAIEGGGFQNVLAVSPFLNGGVRPYLIGADVSGPFRSTDRGVGWTPVNNGSIGNGMRMAAFLWSNVTAGKVWAAEDNGLHRSTDWGVTWAKRPGVVNFDANGARNNSPEHPRATGNMIAQDNSTATKYLWVGCETGGLKQSIDEAATWRSIVMVGHRITAIASDPNNPDILYATVSRGTAAQNGVWRITSARAATMVATRLTSYPGVLTNPRGPEDVICVNDAGTTRVFVAGHESGVYRYTGPADTAGSWVTRNVGLNVNGTAIYNTVYRDESTAGVMYCGQWHPTNRNSIYKSTDLGASWTSVTGPNPVVAPATGDFVINWNHFGSSVRSWLQDIEYHSFAGPNADWLASSLQVDPDVPERLLTCGRGGAWWGTLSGATRTWQPANHGLLVTVCMAVVADNLTAGRAIMGNMDYTNFYTSDGFVNGFQSKNPASLSTGDVVTFDMAPTVGPSDAFYGASEHGSPTGNGSVFSTTSPELGEGTHWVNESSPTWGSDTMALAVGKNSGGTRVILAGVSQLATRSDGGLWRKVGATWTQFRNPATVPFGLADTAGYANMGCIRFRRNSPIVYALDNDALWRSDDAGATWLKILTGVTATYGTYNGLEIDHVNTALVYVSSGGTVRRVNNASTSTGTGNTTVTNIWVGNAGNIAVRADSAEMFINIRDGRLMRSTLHKTAATQAAATWVDVADPFFRNNSGNIRSLGLTPTGVILTADNGSGALRGYVV